MAAINVQDAAVAEYTQPPNVKRVDSPCMLTEYYSIVPSGEHWKSTTQRVGNDAFRSDFRNVDNTRALLKYAFVFHFDKLFPVTEDDDGGLLLPGVTSNLLKYHLGSYPSANKQSSRLAHRSGNDWPSSECRLRRGCDGCDPKQCLIKNQCVQLVHEHEQGDFRTCMSRDAIWQHIDIPCAGVYADAPGSGGAHDNL